MLEVENSISWNLSLTKRMLKGGSKCGTQVAEESGRGEDE